MPRTTELIDLTAERAPHDGSLHELYCWQAMRQALGGASAICAVPGRLRLIGVPLLSDARARRMTTDDEAHPRRTGGPARVFVERAE